MAIPFAATGQSVLLFRLMRRLLFQDESRRFVSSQIPFISSANRSYQAGLLLLTA